MAEHFGYKEAGYKYTTPSRLILPTEVDLFCEISGMREGIFLSDEVAKMYGVKGRVVPGAFLVGIALGLIRETGLIGEVIGSFFLGTDKLQAISPVYPYDKVTVEGEVLNRRVTSKGDKVVVNYSWVMKNQEGTVCAQAENT